MEVKVYQEEYLHCAMKIVMSFICPTICAQRLKRAERVFPAIRAPLKIQKNKFIAAMTIRAARVGKH